MDLFSSVRELHGVGPARAAQLEKLGIRTLYDLLAFFPRDYEDRTNPVTIAQLQPGVPACFRAMVVSQPILRRIGGGRDITKLIVADETGKLTLSYFNQPYVKNQLHYGESYYFYGALQPEHGMQMANPAHDLADRPGAVTNRLLPVYSLTAGLSNRLMTQCVQQALTFAAELLPEILPEQVRREYDLCGVTEAYTTVHQPPDWPALQRARKRLVFEEFFIFSAGLAVLRASRTELSAEPYAADCRPCDEPARAGRRRQRQDNGRSCRVLLRRPERQAGRLYGPHGNSGRAARADTHAAARAARRARAAADRLQNCRAEARRARAARLRRGAAGRRHARAFE